MYESPIQIIQHKIQADLSEKVDESIYTAVVRSDIHVDRDELIRALRYDRCQYEKGFADGKTDAMQWISAKDRLPTIGEKVLVRGVKGGIQTGLFRDAYAHNKRLWHWKKNTVLEVVYWMPQDALPEPPKEDSNDDC